MTQFQHVTDKEMTRRTGVVNALGYTYPEKDLILLKKGLKGKLKKEVINHELNHLAKGEEGPFVISGGAILGAAGIGALGSYLGGQAQADAASRAAAQQREQTAIAREDLSPYREFGAEQLGEFQNWLATPEGRFQAPTMEDVQAGAGYGTRLGAVESSAAARGSLFSGNALRDIGEFGASEYDREYARRQNLYQNELNKRLGLVNLGQSSAAGSANISQRLGESLGRTETQRGAAQAGMYQGIAGSAAGALGAYSGQSRWNDFLERAYPSAASIGANALGPAGGY